MPSRDPSRYVRMALIDALKSLAVTGVGDKWYPQQIPANQHYPYGFVGVPIVSPDGLQCADAATIRFAIHGYTEGETIANQIGERLAEMDGVSLNLQDAGCPYPATVDLNWISNTVIRDSAESTIFHLISQWTAEVMA